jgi:hypothetical protein
VRLEAPIAGMKKGPGGPLYDAGVDAGRCYEVGVSISWILRALGRAQMNGTPPGANNEYSRGWRPSRGESGAAQRGVSVRAAWDRGGLGGRLWGGDRGGSEGVGGAGSAAIRVGILGGVLVGCLLLLAAEFTTLFTVHVDTSATAIKTVITGSHHSYALIPIAVLAAALALGAFRDGGRAGLLAIGLLGIVTLLIGLLGDLPDTHVTGLSGSPTTHFVTARSAPGAGLYLETLGAAVLVITSGVGFIALGPARDQRARSQSAARRSR